MRLSSITELSAAALAILATPAAARPFTKTLSPCLLKVAADVPCVDPLAFHYLLAVGNENLGTLRADLEQYGCAPVDALTITLAAKQCLVEMNQALPNDSASASDPGPEDLRRRDVIADEPQPQPQPRQPVRARGARLMVRATDFNVTVSSAIVGTVLGVAGGVAFIGVCFSCLRERSQKKKARLAAEVKAAAKEAARAEAKARGRK